MYYSGSDSRFSHSENVNNLTEQNRSELSGYFAYLVEFDADGDDRYDEDTSSIDVVVVGAPECDAEDLKDVKRIDYLSSANNSAIK